MDEELARRARTIIRDRYADLGATLAGEKHFDRHFQDHRFPIRKPLNKG
ncbi:hypothetical protein [Burkholderia thailandensis]|nr:hypothetical protein [Burkholderia thailandensis]MCZ2899567.1 hypothetical protein [Burkholderia thailandensis]